MKEGIIMKQRDYLIGQPIKADLNIWDRILCYEMPQSNELNYPVKILYDRYDGNGSAVLQVETINSAEEYLQSMKWHAECGHMIHSIGDLGIDHLRGYVYEINQYVADIYNTYVELKDVTSALLIKQDEFFGYGASEEEIKIKELDGDLTDLIERLSNRLPKKISGRLPKI